MCESMQKMVETILHDSQRKEEEMAARWDALITRCFLKKEGKQTWISHLFISFNTFYNVLQVTRAIQLKIRCM